MPGMLQGSDWWLVPLSLGLSFLANDGEELITMERTLPATLDRLPRWWPVPRSIVRTFDATHVRVGISVIGVVCGAAVVNGIASRGRGALFQDVQLFFGAHGFIHLAASALTQGYTSGVLTAPTVVIPQWWWATRQLRRASVPRSTRLGRAAALGLGSLACAHALGACCSYRGRAAKPQLSPTQIN